LGKVIDLLNEYGYLISLYILYKKLI